MNEKEGITPSESHNEKPVRGDEATLWKPGQSGNPGGRPKRTPPIDACREVLREPVPGDPTGRTYAQAIADKLAAMALAGDIRAAQEARGSCRGETAPDCRYRKRDAQRGIRAHERRRVACVRSRWKTPVMVSRRREQWNDRITNRPRGLILFRLRRVSQRNATADRRA
jgi:hypothetical protein